MKKFKNKKEKDERKKERVELVDEVTIDKVVFMNWKKKILERWLWKSKIEWMARLNERLGLKLVHLNHGW